MASRVTGPPDAASGRHPVRLQSPASAVQAYPDGVKVRTQNLVVLQQPAAKPAQAQSRDHQTQGSRGALPGPADWAHGLSGDAQAEWLCDCYRLRLDDDYCLGGCNLHGVYDPDHTPETILMDFFVFCKMAVINHVIPEGWDWDRFLRKAEDLIVYAFEKSDAQEKYGSENVFAVAMGGRSLRYTGEVVYGSGAMHQSPSPEHQDMEDLSQDLLRLMAQPEHPHLSDVGGAALWHRLLQAISKYPHCQGQDEDWESESGSWETASPP